MVASGEVLLTSLQNVLSTSVGVALAYPILSQIMEIKNEKILSECQRVLKNTQRTHGRVGLNHLGGEKLQFQFHLNRIAKYNNFITTLSIILSLFSFIALIFSSLFPDVKLTLSAAFWLCAASFAPFMMGFILFLIWVDGLLRLSGAISFYRGDYKARYLR